MKVRAVLFDLDGTLVDSLDDLTAAVNHTRAAFGLPQLHSPTVCAMIGKGARHLIRQAVPDLDDAETDRALQLFLDFNQHHIADKSRLYPGIGKTLDVLQGKGIRLAVVSNKNQSLSGLILSALGVRDYFELIAGGDTFAESKPSPLPLLRVADQLGVLPTECVMVGDSINDIEAGNRAGIVTIGCNWGYGNREELSQSTFQVDSCDELISTLIELEQAA
ncbi:MAG TPA: HAD-IA family hydrolase [Desulfuromonadales bacterium]|nr:HAD-IA family hydrolase [Desulfuromonadales bacterium]